MLDQLRTKIASYLLPKEQRSAFNLNTLRQFIYGPPTLAGVNVSPEVSLGLTGVFRALDLYGTTVAGLEKEVRRRTPGKGNVSLHDHPVSLLLNDPNGSMNGFKFWNSYVLQAKASGNAYAEIVRLNDKAGTPIELKPIHWRNVKVSWNQDKTQLEYLLQREQKPVPARDMLHVLGGPSWDGLYGLSPIESCRETLGIGIAAERFAASVYGNGAIPRGYLQVQGTPTPETINSIRDNWEAIMGGVANSNKIGILNSMVKFVETNMSAEDAQVLLSRGFQIQEICRIFSVPPSLLYSGEQNSYNANEQSNIQWYQLGLKSFLTNLETEISIKCLTLEERQRGLHIRFRVDSLLTGLFGEISNVWRPLVLAGVASPNEAREKLGLNPVDGADDRLIPANVIPSLEPGKDQILPMLPAPAGGAPAQVPTEDVAKSAGIQTESLLAIVNSVTTGAIPAATAKGLIAASFPSLSDSDIEAILAPLVGFSASTEVATEAARSAFLAEVGRALRRQVKSNDPVKMRSYLSEALETTLRAYANLTGVECDLTDFVSRWLDYTSKKSVRTIKPEEMLDLLDN